MKLKHVSIGLVFEASDEFMVGIVANSTIYLRAPSGYEIKIAPLAHELAQIIVLKDGRIKVIGKQPAMYQLVLDQSFNLAMLSPVTIETINDRSSHFSREIADMFQAAILKVNQLVQSSKPESQILKAQKLINDLLSSSSVKVFWALVRSKIADSKLSLKNLLEEIVSRLKVEKVDLPTEKEDEES